MTRLFCSPEMSALTSPPWPEPRRAPRRGMTLIEVMVSLTIITSALLGFGAFLTRFMHVSSQSTAASVAMDLAVSRVEAVKSFPTYATLETNFNATESSLLNCVGCVRTTLVTQTSNAAYDYKTVTVTVTVPALSSAYTAAPVSAPFTKTTVIGAF
jgi:prepilin-type N-terminal cleavage/methylation domain-containing protein